MSLSHIPSSVATWTPFCASDATHEQLERLSQEVSTDAVWLVRRDEDAPKARAPMQAGLYRIPVGEFEFESPGDESCFVISGNAIVHVEDGNTVPLKPGDMVFWPRGTRTRWTVTQEFVQFFTMVG